MRVVGQVIVCHLSQDLGAAMLLRRCLLARALTDPDDIARVLGPVQYSCGALIELPTALAASEPAIALSRALWPLRHTRRTAIQTPHLYPRPGQRDRTLPRVSSADQRFETGAISDRTVAYWGVYDPNMQVYPGLITLPRSHGASPDRTLHGWARLRYRGGCLLIPFTAEPLLRTAAI